MSKKSTSRTSGAAAAIGSIVKLTAPTTFHDRRRWRLFNSGLTAAEIAEMEDVQLKTVELSLWKVRADRAQYAPDEMATKVRKILSDRLQDVDNVLKEAMRATVLDTREVVERDPETGHTVQLQESVERADHDTRLRAVTGVRDLIVSVQPREPLVAIDQRSQTNIQNNGISGGNGTGLKSPEAVIRSVIERRSKALTDGSHTAADTPMVVAIDQTMPEDAEPIDEDEDGEEDEIEEDEESEEE